MHQLLPDVLHLGMHTGCHKNEKGRTLCGLFHFYGSSYDTEYFNRYLVVLYSDGGQPYFALNAVEK